MAGGNAAPTAGDKRLAGGNAASTAGGRRTITVDERRARLAWRHHLAGPARVNDPVRIAGDLLGLHATDPASVHLAALARMSSGQISDVERALYDDRTLLRMLGMRRTVFVVPLDLAGVVQAACSRTVAARQRRTFTGFLAKAGVAADADAWLREVEEAALRALHARGEATGAELAAAEPLLRTSMLLSEGKAYEARQNVTTWVLALLSADGRIARGRPRGSWVSSQYRWSPMADWVRGGLAAWDTAEAQVELARRWLFSYGPGTLADLRWWTGWTATETKRALAPSHPVEVDLDGGATGLLLPDDLDPPPPVEQPWAALLPALDPTAMGWTDRDWYLGPHRAALFDRSGNIGPTIWWNGRIVGGWAQRPSGEIAYRLLTDIGADGETAVAAEAARASTWFGPVVVKPRFRTPMDQELSR